MSAVVIGVVKLTFGFLANKIRSGIAERLKDGDITDEECGRLIVKELDYMKSKRDDLTRKKLLTSLCYLQAGISALYRSLFQLDSDSNTTESTGKATSVKAASSRDTGSNSPINEAIALSNATTSLKMTRRPVATEYNKQETTVATNDRFTCAMELFKHAHEAIEAFYKEALSIEDRIQASQIRMMARILESLEDPDASVSDCLQYLRQLHGIPAVQKIFSVLIGGGKDLEQCKKTKQLHIATSVHLINRILFEFARTFQEFPPSGSFWPMLFLSNGSYHPLFGEFKDSDGQVLSCGCITFDDTIICPWFSSKGKTVALTLDRGDREEEAPNLAAKARHVDVKYLAKQGTQVDAKDKMSKDRSLAVQFTFEYPCCVRAIPYETDSKGTQSLTMCLYVHTDDKGIIKDVKGAAERKFADYKIECVDLQRRPLSKIVTQLPSSKRQNGKELSDLSGKIEENLNVFENRLNVTAVCASYKVVDAIEKDIPCVTVFVVGKGRIPAEETDIKKLKEDNSHLFGDTEFDVVEGYYQPAFYPTPWSEMAYAFQLRGGVGIGVNGVPGVGTLGGFLKDDKGECYILSNEHVLNPPRPKNNTRDDSTKDVVHDAGTSDGLSKDVETNTIDVEMENSTKDVVHDPGASRVLLKDIDTNTNTNNVEMENRTKEVIHSAGTSVGLVEDVEGKSHCRSVDVRHPFEVGNNTNDIEMNNSTGKVIEQPAKTDYDKMLEDAQELKDTFRKKYPQLAELPQAEVDELKKNGGSIERVLDRWDLIKQNFVAIENEKPRKIATYVDGLKDNVEVTLGCSKSIRIYVDVAMAKLEEKELKPMSDEEKGGTNCCPLYGFEKIKDIIPTGETVDLETFVKEIGAQNEDVEPEEQMKFLKIGRGTGLTDEGRIDTKVNSMFVKCFSTPNLPDVPIRYCEKCKPSDISETELIYHEYYGPQTCAICNKKFEKCDEKFEKCDEEFNKCDKEVDKRNTHSFWKLNCFVIRRHGWSFCEEGDSGSIIFDDRGRGWGLVHGLFCWNDVALCLASPLGLALEALGNKCGKKLELWKA